MKVLIGFLSALAFLAGGSAWGNEACEKCTHDMQVQYRRCIQSGQAQATCAKEQQETAQKCVAICNPK